MYWGTLGTGEDDIGDDAIGEVPSGEGVDEDGIGIGVDAGAIAAVVCGIDIGDDVFDSFGFAVCSIYSIKLLLAVYVVLTPKGET